LPQKVAIVAMVTVVARVLSVRRRAQGAGLEASEEMREGRGERGTKGRRD